MQKQILKLIFLFAIFFTAPNFAKAATYYVCGNATSCNAGSSGWSAGNNANNGTSKSTPKLTITAGISTMAGGDTLIIGNGIYVADPLWYIKSGSIGAYTVVKAENVAGVTVDMSSVTAAWVDLALYITGNYIQVEGIRFKGNPDHDPDTSKASVGLIEGGTHNKIISCAFYGATRLGNVAPFALTSGANYNLVEDCWAWGTGRYMFLSYTSNNNIFRRCVARHDWHDTQTGAACAISNSGYACQVADFTNYDSTDTLIQNCIAIDSSAVTSTQERVYGGFWDESNENAGNTISKRGKIVGSIALNIKNNIAGILDKVSDVRVSQNNVVWDSGGGIMVLPTSGSAHLFSTSLTIANLTIGNINSTYTVVGDYPTGKGTGIDSAGNMGVSTMNSIIYNTNVAGIGGHVSSSYNSFYDNLTNFIAPANAGIGDRTVVNPLTNGLLYLPRIEDASTLKTAGSGGSQVGAQITKQYGKSGTLYGEAGYDLLQDGTNGQVDINLWPFPNEDKIKADFASYSGPGPAGARGFATGTSIDGSSQTLTKYIWEYLGNQIPCEIYGTCSSDVIAPSAPSGLSVL